MTEEEIDAAFEKEFPGPMFGTIESRHVYKSMRKAWQACAAMYEEKMKQHKVERAKFQGKIFSLNAQLKDALKDAQEWESLTACEATVDMKRELDEARAETERLKGALVKFCTLSNSVSMMVRADWRSDKKNKESIVELYNYQCDVENMLEHKPEYEVGDKNE